MVNGHKSAAHTDSADGGTRKTCLGGGMHCPSASSYGRPICNRAGHIYFHPVVSSSSSSFYPRLISAVGDWISTILPHMVHVGLVYI